MSSFRNGRTGDGVMRKLV